MGGRRPGRLRGMQLPGPRALPPGGGRTSVLRDGWERPGSLDTEPATSPLVCLRQRTELGAQAACRGKGVFVRSPGCREEGSSAGVCRGSGNPSRGTVWLPPNCQPSPGGGPSLGGWAERNTVAGLYLIHTREFTFLIVPSTAFLISGSQMMRETPTTTHKINPMTLRECGLSQKATW